MSTSADTNPGVVAARASSNLTLLGRRSECEELDGLLDEARSVHSGVRVLIGEAGIGKTALLDYAMQSAPHRTVLRTAGIQAEMELAFAGLHQLCAPLLDSRAKLSAPHCSALETTFGLRTGPVPDRFLLGLAVLGLLSEAAEERPILCVVDDAHWLDQASTEVIAFVARRVVADPIVMLFATRELHDAMVGLPTMPINRLDDDDARELLTSVLPGRLDDRVRDQLIAETKGNPLALRELPRMVAMSDLAGGYGLPRARSLEGRIEASFRQRFELLAPNARELLLVAAAEPLGDPGLLWRAAEHLQIDESARASAEAAGLLEIDRRVRFVHPLMRSAVYEAAQPVARRRVHRALAEATDPEAEPDRRAWHRAEGAASPDEEIALELVQAAGRAQARGGLAAAAAFLERAGALTPDRTLQVERNLAAARTKYEAGALGDALALLSALQSDVLDEGQRAEMKLLRAEIAFASNRGSDAPPLLLGAARDLESDDPARARATYLQAISACMFVDQLARDGDVVRVSTAALAGPPLPDSPKPSDLLLEGLAVRFTSGLPAGVPILKDAVSAFRRATDLPVEESRWLWLASNVALHLWDDDMWEALLERQLSLVREAGALAALPMPITSQISYHANHGELDEAVALETELRAVTEATGIARSAYAPLMLAAIRGRESEFAELAQTIVGDAKVRGEGLALTVNAFLSGMLHNGLGNYSAALAAVSDIGTFPEEGPVSWALTELMEAAVRLGQFEPAVRALAVISSTTQATGTDWGLGIEARCRALVSRDDVAEDFYLEAIERLARTRIRFQYARAHLLYGEWLRRQRRRADAREHLRTAHAMFNRSGVEAFADRAARELIATGENARKRTVDVKTDLTPQELQIARLARDGLSNAEIGSRLFVSRYTVEYHLRKIFVKLGIDSRTKLARVLPPSPGSAPAP